MMDQTRSRLVRLPEVKDRTGLSRTSIYRKMDAGEFPLAVKLSANAVAWRETELERWIAAPTEWQAAA
ncbi:AlpA family transcriptional regulator [uncultured Sphingomonas sp.]|uniref:helix-turn-helix transcriptional regulator n=1 Tax=uncultured Sphingomonas sp. TaxID=158754 RepID=UPI0025FA55DF|nr:AlpA family phage regulatory protein [uncultured Sphingomonas sp.]